MRSMVPVIMVVMLTMVALPALAGKFEVPTGTAVPLQFLAPVDSSTIQQGATIRFVVATDVLVRRAVVFRKGTPAQGTVTDVAHPGIYGGSAHVHIAYIQANAVDGRPVHLSPLDLAPDSAQQVRDVGAALGASAAGAILFHSVGGLAAGALIRGGDVSLPAGAVGLTRVIESFRLTTP